MNEDELKRLHNRIDHLESLIQALKDNKNPTYTITIDKAEFKSPVVDQLNYYFDKLDVKEVSGSLNLGNNFGIPTGKKTGVEKGLRSEKNSDTNQSVVNTKSTTDSKKVSEQVTDKDANTDLNRDSNQEFQEFDTHQSRNSNQEFQEFDTRQSRDSDQQFQEFDTRQSLDSNQGLKDLHTSQNQKNQSTASSSEKTTIKERKGVLSNNIKVMHTTSTIENDQVSKPSAQSSPKAEDDLEHRKEDNTPSPSFVQKWTNRKLNPIRRESKERDNIPFKITIKPRSI